MKGAGKPDSMLEFLEQEPSLIEMDDGAHIATWDSGGSGTPIVFVALQNKLSAAIPRIQHPRAGAEAKISDPIVVGVGIELAIDMPRQYP